MVLPMSFSPSQSPPSILHFLHAAETTATSSDGSRGTAMDSGPAVALGLGLKRRTGPGGRGQSTRLKLAIARDLQFLPHLSARTEEGEAETLGDWSEACVLSWARVGQNLLPPGPGGQSFPCLCASTLQRLAGEDRQH